MEESLRGGQPCTGSRPDSGARQSQPELDFVSRWKQLVDKAGGQAKAARLPGWSRSTASRDYNGKTLPTDERLHQLCQQVRLSAGDELELAALLGKARAARKSNLRGDGAVSQEQARDKSWCHAVDHPGSAPADDKVPPGPSAVRPPGRGWRARGSWRTAVAMITVVGAALVGGYPVLSQHGTGQGPKAADPATPASASSARSPGTGVHARPEQVPIPVASLITSLAGDFRHGLTAGKSIVTGFQFRVTEDLSFCLSADTAGLRAGLDNDPVVVEHCDLLPSEIWIPEQWEIHGDKFTQLVNDEYQSMCLHSDNSYVPGEGPAVRLQNCYVPGGESWDFGDWNQAIYSGGNSVPLFLGSTGLCLDTDVPDLYAGKLVHVRPRYPTADQLWS